MKVWIDNTSLHGGGRCIGGSAKSEYDIRNLLQLSSLIVFSEKIEIGGFEGGEIFQATGDFLDSVQKLGVPGSLIDRIDLTPQQYGDACFRAAESAFDDIQLGQSEFSSKGQTGSLDMPIGAVHPFERLTEIVEADDKAFLEDVAASSLELKGTGAIDHMIARSENLRHSLRRLRQSGQWDEVSSFHISAYLRGLLNLEIARAQSDEYFPSANRAEFLSSTSNRIHRLARTHLDALNDVTAEVPLDNQALDLPLGPVGFYLLEKSRGDPRGIIQTASELREQLAPSLKNLAKIRDGLRSINSSKKKAARIARDEMAQHIRFELGMEASPSLVDLLKVEWIVGHTVDSELTFAMHPAKEFFRWYKYQLNKKRYFGVVEVASAFADSQIDNRHLVHLRRLARKER